MSKRRVRIVSAAAFYVSRKENAELAFSDKVKRPGFSGDSAHLISTSSLALVTPA